MKRTLCLCAVFVCFICVIGCKKKNVNEKIEDNNESMTSVESLFSQEDSSIQEINNQDGTMQSSEIKLPDDREIESLLNLTENERNTELGADSEIEIKKASEDSNEMNASNILNFEKTDFYADNLEASKKDYETDKNNALKQLQTELTESFNAEKKTLLENQKSELTAQFNLQLEAKVKEYEEEKQAALEQLRKELTEHFDTEKQQLLETQKTELTKEFNTQIEVKAKEYQEEKETALEQLRKELTESFDAEKQQSLESQKNELTEQYNKKFEEKTSALEREKTDALEKLKESFEIEKKQALANKEEELNKTFEEKKAREIKEIEASINKKYNDEFETKKNAFIDETRTQLMSELEQTYKQEKEIEVNGIKAELQQKKNDEIAKLKIQLKQEAIEANHSYTERFKIAALYMFIIVLIIITIITVISLVIRHKRDIERKILADKEEKKQLELQKKREMGAHADRENLKKLLIIKHFEYLKSTKGDKASAIEYFMEHEGKENYSIEYEAFQKAVELYEHPNKG